MNNQLNSIKNYEASGVYNLNSTARANPVASSISSGIFSFVVLEGTQGYNYIQQRAFEEFTGGFDFVTPSSIPKKFPEKVKSNRSDTLSEELDDIYRECSKANWDGYRAKPVLKSLRRTVERFLDAIPANIPDPELSADPDGEISLDWCYENGKLFSISIGKRITYAVIDGDNSNSGKGNFNKKIPDSVIYHLNEFISDKT